MAIEYILQGEYEFRALAWLAEFYRERIKLYESLDPDTDRGRELQEIISSDRWSGGTLTLKDDANYKKWADNYREQLKSEKFKAVQESFSQLKKALKRKPKWYQLTPVGNQGPGNIRELAETLKMLGFYEVLYRGLVYNATRAGACQIPNVDRRYGTDLPASSRSLPTCYQRSIRLALYRFYNEANGREVQTRRRSEFSEVVCE